MSRIVSLVLVAIVAALPVMPLPGVCHMRHHAAMHPCCAATQTRAPIKVVRTRVDVAPPAVAPRIVRAEPPAETRPAADNVALGAFWQPLATIQLRI